MLRILCLFVLPVFGVSQLQASFEVQQVAEGVFAVLRKEPPGMMFDSNSVLIVNQDDVTVVDTNISPESAFEVIATLKKITSKPVRYVINTHWHEDHILGNATYRKAYPGVTFIGHPNTLIDLPSLGAANRKSLREGAPGFIASIREQIKAGKSLLGTPITEEERLSHDSDIAMVERYLGEIEGIPILLPELMLDQRLVLRSGSRQIEILYLGKAHTASDLVVLLPKEEILISGDLVVWPIPLIGSTSFPLAYAETLQKMLALPHKQIIPGHGPVLKDDSYPLLELELLLAISSQTKAAFAKGESLEQAKKSVDLTSLKAKFAGSSQLFQLVFTMYVQDSGVSAAYQELGSKKSGLQ